MQISNVSANYAPMSSTRSCLSLSESNVKMIDEVVTSDMKTAEVATNVAVSLSKENMQILQASATKLFKSLDIYI